MTKQEFLSRLEGLLQDLEPEDREDALAFYREYLEDAGEENEQSALADLGDVEELAKQIRAACPVRQQDNQQAPNPSPEPTRWPAPTQYVRPEDTFQQESQTQQKEAAKYTKKSSLNTATIVVIVLIVLVVAFPVVVGILGALFGVWAVSIIAFVVSVICTIVGLFAIGNIGVGGLIVFGASIFAAGISLIVFAAISWLVVAVAGPWVRRGILFCKNLLSKS